MEAGYSPFVCGGEQHHEGEHHRNTLGPLGEQDEWGTVCYRTEGDFEERNKKIRLNTQKSWADRKNMPSRALMAVPVVDQRINWYVLYVRDLIRKINDEAPPDLISVGFRNIDNCCLSCCDTNCYFNCCCQICIILFVIWFAFFCGWLDHPEKDLERQFHYGDCLAFANYSIGGVYLTKERIFGLNAQHWALYHSVSNANHQTFLKTELFQMDIKDFVNTINSPPTWPNISHNKSIHMAILLFPFGKIKGNLAVVKCTHVESGPPLGGLKWYQKYFNFVGGCIVPFGGHSAPETLRPQQTYANGTTVEQMLSNAYVYLNHSYVYNLLGDNCQKFAKESAYDLHLKMDPLDHLQSWRDLLSGPIGCLAVRLVALLGFMFRLRMTIVREHDLCKQDLSEWPITIAEFMNEKMADYHVSAFLCIWMLTSLLFGTLFSFFISSVYVTLFQNVFILLGFVLSCPFPWCNRSFIGTCLDCCIKPSIGTVTTEVARITQEWDATMSTYAKSLESGNTNLSWAISYVGHMTISSGDFPLGRLILHTDPDCHLLLAIEECPKPIGIPARDALNYVPSFENKYYESYCCWCCPLEWCPVIFILIFLAWPAPV